MKIQSPWHRTSLERVEPQSGFGDVGEGGKVLGLLGTAFSGDPFDGGIPFYDATTGLVDWVALLGLFGAVISPPALAANTDNWNPAGLAPAAVIRADLTADWNLTGLVPPAATGQRTFVLLANVSAHTLTLKHDVTSVVANRFYCPGDADAPLAKDTAVLLWYDPTSTHWRLAGGAGGSSITFGLVGDITSSAPGDATAAGATTRVADAGHKHGREAWGGAGDMSGSVPGDAVAVGASGKEADAGHRHAREAWAVVGDITTAAYADAPAAGASGHVADGAHRHGMFSPRKHVINAIFDGGSTIISTGKYIRVKIPWACTITRVTMLSDASTTATVDIWRTTQSSYDGGATHPVVGDSIVGTDIPTIMASTKSDDSALTGWGSTALSAGNVLEFYLASNSAAMTLTVALELQP